MVSEQNGPTDTQKQKFVFKFMQGAKNGLKDGIHVSWWMRFSCNANVSWHGKKVEAHTS